MDFLGQFQSNSLQLSEEILGKLRESIFNHPTSSKRLIGDQLYYLVQKVTVDRSNAGKITGMLLELDNDILLNMLESPEFLKSEVEETEKSLV